jgi:peroxiredoxin
MRSLVPKLETVANLAIVATCSVFLILVATRLVVSRQSPSQRKNPGILVKGESLPAPLADRTFLRGAQRTLFMYLRSDCQFCASGVPFYQRLSHDVRLRESGRAQLALVTSDSADKAAEYVSQNNLSVLRTFAIAPQNLASLKLPGTPSLVLVDSDGVIKRVWIGALDDGHQAEVLDALFGQE